jgi:hypothetical protein
MNLGTGNSRIKTVVLNYIRGTIKSEVGDGGSEEERQQPAQDSINHGPGQER